MAELRAKMREMFQNMNAPKISLITFLGLCYAYGNRRWENENNFEHDELPIDSARFVVNGNEWVEEKLRGDVIEAILRVAKVVNFE